MGKIGLLSLLFISAGLLLITIVLLSFISSLIIRYKYHFLVSGIACMVIGIAFEAGHRKGRSQSKKHYY